MPKYLVTDLLINNPEITEQSKWKSGARDNGSDLQSQPLEG